MSNNVGTITIEMAANIARLQRDMDHACRTVDGAMSRIRSAVSTAKVAMAGLGVGLSAAGLVAWVKGAVDAADSMTKFGRATGLATEQVAGIQLAFRQGGVDAGAMQTGLNRLNKAIADGSKAFTAMGVSTRNADGSLKINSSRLTLTLFTRRVTNYWCASAVITGYPRSS